MLLKSLTISKSDFEIGTGWIIKPDGACKGDICIPIDIDNNDQIDVKRISQNMNLPLVEEAVAQLWALGPDSIGGRTLTSAEAPNLRLPDLNGKEFSLSSLRGKKVLIYAWAPY
jgi:hypothetical protein